MLSCPKRLNLGRHSRHKRLPSDSSKKDAGVVLLCSDVSGAQHAQSFSDLFSNFLLEIYTALPKFNANCGPFSLGERVVTAAGGARRGDETKTSSRAGDESSGVSGGGKKHHSTQMINYKLLPARGSQPAPLELLVELHQARVQVL